MRFAIKSPLKRKYSLHARFISSKFRVIESVFAKMELFMQTPMICFLIFFLKQLCQKIFQSLFEDC